MYFAMLVTVALPGQSQPSELELLKTFRSEFVELTPGTGIYPAELVMGHSSARQANERPAQRVVLTRSFAIAKYEVPQNLWQAVMGTNPSRWKGPRNSCEMLSFDEAQRFCRQVTKLMRSAELIRDDEVIRLPTEVEWEYAARAGTSTIYSFGNDPSKLGEYAWYTGNAAGNDPPVGAKKPNPWGLYDMHGYLWEWCADVWHQDDRAARTDENAGTVPNYRVVRGGSWKDSAEQLTSSYRRRVEKSTRDDAIGFRCVLARE